jgi:hypothetical protein
VTHQRHSRSSPGAAGFAASIWEQPRGPSHGAQSRRTMHQYPQKNPITSPVRASVVISVSYGRPPSRLTFPPPHRDRRESGHALPGKVQHLPYHALWLNIDPASIARRQRLHEYPPGITPRIPREVVAQLLAPLLFLSIHNARTASCLTCFTTTANVYDVSLPKMSLILTMMA